MSVVSDGQRKDPPARILTAGRRLMATRGNGFTTQDLIQEADVALQTFYRYFGGKDQLLVAVLAESIGDHCARLLAEARPLTDPVARLETYVRSTLEPLGNPALQPAARFITSELW